MYINKIDEIIDSLFDDFFNNVAKTKFDKILSFTKFQENINNILVAYVESINKKDLITLFHDSDNVQFVLNIIKQYLMMYTFFFIALINKIDSFDVEVVQFSREQSISAYNFKIDNFFNTETNSLIINLHKAILDLFDYFKTNKSDNPYTKDFVNTLGKEYIDANFKNIKNDKEKYHNIIKTLILLYRYRQINRKEIFNILEFAGETEYIFIDVVIPLIQHIDFDIVEKILTKRELSANLTNDFYNLLSDADERNKSLTQTMSIDDKILKLFNSKMFVPIVDDFMLYHKDNEIYDKNAPDEVKSKKDTKIKYIVTKIDNISELYSEAVKKNSQLTAEISNLFYHPLLDRKAILFNQIEDIKIINTFINRRSVEISEYYKDFVFYSVYPYINFKDFEKDGFSLIVSSTLDVIRQASFISSKSNPLQLRIAPPDHVVNIVGIMLPPQKTKLGCLKIADIIDIQELDKHANEKGHARANNFELLLKYLRQTDLNLNANKPISWLFNSDVDLIIGSESYEQMSNISNSEKMKLIISKIYDELVPLIYYFILSKLGKNVLIQKALKFINVVEDKLMKLTPRVYDLLESKLYYELSVKNKPEYDINEDVLFEYGEKKFKLPVIEKIKKSPMTTIIVGKEIEQKIVHEKKIADSICQHNISWEILVSVGKSDPKRYETLLYEFIQQYVFESEDGFTCKSCAALINIKKYILDGVYDNDTHHFITFSTPMEVPLEDIPEYAKFKIAIRNMDKLIEKIANISNIPNLIGSSMSVKWKRKSIIKNTIDIVILNNKHLKNVYKTRIDTVVNKYGITKELTNLFTFDFENAIFIFSSKEKDYYKNIKHNNIIGYLILMIVLELNNTHITYITGDGAKGMCNYKIFEKFGNNLFNNLNIIKNKAGDLEPLKNYPVLCYILYIVICMISKYNLWFYEGAIQKKFGKRIADPKVQKIIINTFVDILNSILETYISNQQTKSIPVYEITAVKFFTKLSTTFSVESLLNSFKTDNTNANVNETKKHDTHTFEIITLAQTTNNQVFEKVPFNPIHVAMYNINLRNPNDEEDDFPLVVNNITNCPDGQFHKWIINPNDKKTMICEICGITLGAPNFDERKSQEIYKAYEINHMKSIIKRFCDKKGQTVGSSYKQCNDISKLTDKEIFEFISSLHTIDVHRATQEKTQAATTKVSKSEKLQEKDIEHKDFITDFINLILTIKTEKDLNIQNNIYIIDHDYNGYSLDKPIMLSESDNKIIYKQNHQFFNANVIYYSIFRPTGRVDIFYDASSLILLGYKEQDKDYMRVTSDRKIIVNYSFTNKLKYLGYTSKFININEYNNHNNYNTTSDPDALTDTVENIVRDRLDNLRQIIYYFKGIISKFANRASFTKKQDYAIDELIEKYLNTLNNLTTFEENPLSQYARIDLSNINIPDAKIVSIDDLNKYNNQWKYYLFYLLSMFYHLIDKNKNMKITLINFYIDFINIIFEFYNVESRNSNIYIKRFYYIVKSSTFIFDVYNDTKDDTEIYDPDVVTEKNEEMFDEREREDAIDMEMEFNYAFAYESAFENSDLVTP